eukprot:scaffold115704_cov75-Phaeocystis_antarctica.AAC.1
MRQLVGAVLACKVVEAGGPPSGLVAGVESCAGRQLSPVAEPLLQSPLACRLAAELDMVGAAGVFVSSTPRCTLGVNGAERWLRRSEHRPREHQN